MEKKLFNSKKLGRLATGNIGKVLGKTGMSTSRIKELKTEEEDILEKNLVWVFASPRSGTSWLANELLSYCTHTMDEPYIGHHLESIGIAQNRQKLIDFHKKRNTYFFSDLYKNTWKFFLRKLILNRIHVQFQDLSRKIIIKEPNGSLGADNLIGCLPSSKIIIVLRDGRDVVDSLIDSRKEGAWGIESDSSPITFRNKFAFLKKQSELWTIRTKLLLKIYKNYNKDLRLKIKYEMLKENTIEELKKIYEFLDIKIPESELNNLVKKYSFDNIPEDKKGTGKVKRSASPGKWKENFNEEEKNAMKEIMGKMLLELGY